MIGDYVGRQRNAKPLFQRYGQLHRHRRIQTDTAEFGVRFDVVGGKFSMSAT